MPSSISVAPPLGGSVIDQRAAPASRVVAADVGHARHAHAGRELAQRRRSSKSTPIPGRQRADERLAYPSKFLPLSKTRARNDRALDIRTDARKPHTLYHPHGEVSNQPATAGAGGAERKTVS